MGDQGGSFRFHGSVGGKRRREHGHYAAVVRAAAGRRSSGMTPSARAETIPPAVTPGGSGVSRLLSSVGSERVQIASGSAPRQLDLESRAWIEGLRATGAEHAAAIEQLHELLLQPPSPKLGVVSTSTRRSTEPSSTTSAGRLPTTRSSPSPKARRIPRLQPLHDMGVRVRDPGGLGQAPPPRMARTQHPDRRRRPRLGPAGAEGTSSAQAHVESAELLQALRRAVAEELTPRQREVFVAVALNDVQIDVVAGQLHSTRGAVYKVLQTHDGSFACASNTKAT